jgi:hypothetical protein
MNDDALAAVVTAAGLLLRSAAASATGGSRWALAARVRGADRITLGRIANARSRWGVAGWWYGGRRYD